MTTVHGRTERSVLAFQRDPVFAGVHVARIGLRQAENSTFHHHTTTRDTFFVMSGRLTIDIRVDDTGAPSAYKLLCVSSVPEAVTAKRTGLQRVILQPGDVCVIEPGVVHCAMNLDPEPCHFLCIEGIGEYDFKEVGL